MNNLSTALKLLAGVVLASIFIGFFVTMWSKYYEGAKTTEFRRDAEEMADIIKSLGSQDPSAQNPYDIVVPEACELRFENSSVVADTGSDHSYETGVDLIGGDLPPGEYHLLLRRTGEGVEITVE